MVKMSEKQPLKNKLGKQSFVVNLLSEFELRIFQAREQLLELKNRLDNEQVLEHINNAVSELNGDTIDLYNIMNAYYSLDRIVMMRCHPSDEEFLKSKDEIHTIRQLIVVPYYKAMIEDQKSTIAYIKNESQNPDLIGDFEYELKKANEALVQFKKLLQSALAMDALYELEKSKVIKLGKSKEEAI